MAPLAAPISAAQPVIPAAPLVLVDVEVDQGITGTAYIFACTPLILTLLVQFLDALSELFTDHTATPADVARTGVAPFRLLGRQGMVGMARAGLDMALRDTQRKAAGQPV